MRDPLTPEEREVLGLEDAELGDAVAVTELVGDPGRGLTTGEGLDLDAMLESDEVDWLQIGPLATPVPGMAVRYADRRRAVLSFETTDGTPLSARHRGASPSAWRVDAPTGSNVFVDTSVDGLWVISRMGVAGFLVRGGRDARVSPFGTAPQPVAIAPFGVIAAPVEDWLAGLRDPWLADLARTCTSLERPWAAAVAAGLIVRLSEPANDSASLASLFETLARGGLDPLGGDVRAWARALPEARLRDLEDLLAAYADDLVRTLDAAIVTTDSEARAECALAWRHRRDDITCVGWVFQAAGRLESYRAVVGPLDDWARPRLADAAWAPPVEDERLARVRLAEPDAWWAAEEASGA